jgi:hypothetical protein
MSDLDGEWLEALGIEGESDSSDADDKGSADDTSSNDTSSDDKKGADDDKGSDGVDDGADDSSNNDSGDDSGSDDADADGDEGRETDEPKDEPDQKELTKQAIKEALAESESEKASRSSQIGVLKEEVIERLYPEGIDRQLRDSDGDPITGIEDLTKLINPRTNELFTDEEAGAWLLAAQQKLNKDIEAVEKFAEEVAEVNYSVTEGAKRVAVKYGAILSADEALKNRLLKAYNDTLIKDPKTGITLRNPVDVEEFFDLALEPRLEARIAADEEAKIKAAEDAKKGQQDRGDLKPNGKSENLDPDDKEWAEAYKNYEQGVR